ncbi:MAG: hypothetical protein ACOC1O_05920 [bacterium]
MSNNFLRTLYLDPELHSNIKIQLIKDKIEKKDKIYNSITELVLNTWETFLQSNMNIKGYRIVKGKVLKTTDMDKTTVSFPTELNNLVKKYLSRFDNKEAKLEDKSFSLITNELLQRIYLDQEI